MSDAIAEGSEAMFIELISDLLKDGFKVSFTAPGNSMSPTIRTDETVLVEPIEPSAIKKDDIVLYRSNGNLIAHRVMGIVTGAGSDEYSALLEVFNPASTPTAFSFSQSAPRPVPPSSFCSPRFFILRGDAALTCADPVQSRQILGKVVAVQRTGHWVNPYSPKYKLACRARIWASCLKRLLS